jgi:hypothetical protein
MTDDTPQLSYLHPRELHESEINPRRIDADRFAALIHAMEQDPDMLDARPIIATLDGEVVAGNMRLRAAAAMHGDPGYPNFNAYVDRRGGVPTFLANLSEKRKREWMLRDNQPYGEYVETSLQALLADYTAMDDADPLLTGFEPDAIDRLLGSGPASDDGDGAGDAGVDADPDVWGVVVECDDEQAQVELLERLDDEGYSVRALL